MPTKFANNAVTKIAVAIGTTDVTILVTPGTGAKFPAISGPADWYPLTAVKSDGTTETMKVTNRVNDTFTVLRAQEGTAATSFALNDIIGLRLSSAQLQEFLQRDGSVSMTGDLDMGTHKVSGVANATDADDAVNKSQLDALKTYADGLVATGKNGFGSRTVSTSDPSGGVDGDIWYKV